MNISTIGQLDRISSLQAKTPELLNNKNNNATFEALFQSAMSMVKETNAATNKAEEEEIKYALGMVDSPNELQAAQQKANISVQYTVAVRNAVLDAYKEIMNMQF